MHSASSTRTAWRYAGRGQSLPREIHLVHDGGGLGWKIETTAAQPIKGHENGERYALRSSAERRHSP